MNTTFRAAVPGREADTGPSRAAPAGVVSSFYSDEIASFQIRRRLEKGDTGRSDGFRSAAEMSGDPFERALRKGLPKNALLTALHAAFVGRERPMGDLRDESDAAAAVISHIRRETGILKGTRSAHDLWRDVREIASLRGSGSTPALSSAEFVGGLMILDIASLSVSYRQAMDEPREFCRDLLSKIRRSDVEQTGVQPDMFIAPPGIFIRVGGEHAAAWGRYGRVSGGHPDTLLSGPAIPDGYRGLVGLIKRQGDSADVRRGLAHLWTNMIYENYFSSSAAPDLLQFDNGLFLARSEGEVRALIHGLMPQLRTLFSSELFGFQREGRFSPSDVEIGKPIALGFRESVRHLDRIGQGWSVPTVRLLECFDNAVDEVWSDVGRVRTVAEHLYREASQERFGLHPDLVDAALWGYSGSRIEDLYRLTA